MTRLEAKRETWPRMAQTVHEAGAKLQAHYGEEGLPPSDYCYNVVNRPLA